MFCRNIDLIEPVCYVLSTKGEHCETNLNIITVNS